MFNFVMKKMIKAKMKDIPEAEQDRILEIMEKNPDFFQTLAVKVQEKIAQGKNQMTAVMEVMKENQEKLKEITK
ncbi:hypothetical protein IT397_02510 [Candidatus Nomurabacteria bacterium]|nr:hypothetical protein [Candidatus Nomurabacteria bacterium]